MAVVMEAPERLVLSRLALTPATDEDVTVDIEWSGISTGTERLLWTGRMPSFPGMGYPLVPGYESVGRVSAAGSRSGGTVGDRVFVPGAKCFGDVKGLFGGAAARVILPGARTIKFDEQLGEQGVLLALAATAHHAHSMPGLRQPDLIIGHGVLGRMIARLAVAAGASPTVWETNATRRDGAAGVGFGYEVVDPATDTRRDYQCICDVSGDSKLLDTLIARLAPGGEVVLAGFYDEPLSFVFPPAFMREARIRIAAQWLPQDLVAVRDLIDSGRLSLDGLITHRADATQADQAYRTAFSDPACLKMILDWRACS
jgi:bacteriochlorophyllide a dehydrogenase